jgi:outer membrane lipoprotein
MIYRTSLATVMALLLSGCAQSAHQTGQDLLDRIIPAGIREQVDESITFADLRSGPDAHTGRTVMVSGLAMKSRRVKDYTEIEVLHLPTEKDMTPSDRRSQSEGRFLAIKTGEFLDPALIEEETPLTVIGEVKPTVTRKLDEGEYQYPVIEIRHVVDWDEVRRRDQRYGSRYGAYGGYYGGYGYGPYSPWFYGFGNPFWGPYGMYGMRGMYGMYGMHPYPYYGFYGRPLGPTSPAPSRPPPSSVPPQFNKSR